MASENDREMSQGGKKLVETEEEEVGMKSKKKGGIGQDQFLMTGLAISRIGLAGRPSSL